jgi:hypothetical protein
MAPPTPFTQSGIQKITKIAILDLTERVGTLELILHKQGMTAFSEFKVIADSGRKGLLQISS